MMAFLNYYYKTVLKREFLTKYRYSNIYQLPKLKKIVLSFALTPVSLKMVLPLLSSLFLISTQKPKLLVSKRVSVVLRVKSGLPVGCRVDLRKQSMFLFFEKLIFFVFPRIKELDFAFTETTVFFSLPNLFVFKEIEKEYEHFVDLPQLSLNLVFRAKCHREIFDFLRVFHFPLVRRTV